MDQDGGFSSSHHNSMPGAPHQGGMESLPDGFCLYLIGQNFVIRPQLAARKAGKCRIKKKIISWEHCPGFC